MRGPQLPARIAFMDKPALLLSAARTLAAGNPAFQDVLGPGAGDKATAMFLRQLHLRLNDSFVGGAHTKSACIAYEKNAVKGG